RPRLLGPGYRWLRHGLILDRQARLELMGDVTRYVSLKPKDVAHVALIARGPEVFIRRAINELGGDAHAIARALNRAFVDSTHVKFARDPRQGFLGLFVLLGGRARTY